jgi:hypothetical protein
MGDRAGAIQSAMNLWGVKGLSQPAYYEKDIAYSGDTKFYPDTGAIVVRIGEAGTENARVLISTAYHEGVHVAQAQGGNYSTESSLFGGDVNELEAYNSELALASQLGLTHGEVAAIREYQQTHWNRIVGTAEYESRVQAGNYRLLKGDYIE